MGDLGALGLAVAEELDARVYVYSGSIDGTGFAELVKSMQPSEAQPMRQNSVLILTTNGGQANAAYQIARLLQDTSSKFYVHVPMRCKSAGTLIALGATHLIMGDIAQLGPLDVQLLKADEIGERKSGLVVRTAFDGLSDECSQLFDKIMIRIKVQGATISFEKASSIATQIVTGVMAPVYAQINPDVLGSDLRDLRVAMEYGNRLVEVSQNAKRDTVDKLVSSFPAHDFIIDSKEAKALFKNVLLPSKPMTALTRELGRSVFIEQQPHCIYRVDKLPDDPKGNHHESDKDSEQISVEDGAAVDAAREADRHGDASQRSNEAPARRIRKPRNEGSASAD